MMCSTWSTSTANCITDRQLRSACTTTLAMLRWTNTSPGCMPVIWLAGTRESEQPIHRYFGACCSARRLKNAGSSRTAPAAQSRLLRSRASMVEGRSEEHTSELQSLMRISYAVFCLQKQTQKLKHHNIKTP